jgi:hypothetical protein
MPSFLRFVQSGGLDDSDDEKREREMEENMSIYDVMGVRFPAALKKPVDKEKEEEEKEKEVISIFHIMGVKNPADPQHLLSLQEKEKEKPKETLSTCPQNSPPSQKQPSSLPPNPLPLPPSLPPLSFLPPPPRIPDVSVMEADKDFERKEKELSESERQTLSTYEKLAMCAPSGLPPPPSPPPPTFFAEETFSSADSKRLSVKLDDHNLFEGLSNSYSSSLSSAYQMALMSNNPSMNNPSSSVESQGPQLLRTSSPTPYLTLSPPDSAAIATSRKSPKPVLRSKKKKHQDDSTGPLSPLSQSLRVDKGKEYKDKGPTVRRASPSHLIRPPSPSSLTPTSAPSLPPLLNHSLEEKHLESFSKSDRSMSSVVSKDESQKHRSNRSGTTMVTAVSPPHLANSYSPLSPTPRNTQLTGFLSTESFQSFSFV